MVKTSLQRFLRETIPFIFLAEKVSSKILWFILCLQRLFEKNTKKNWREVATKEYLKNLYDRISKETFPAKRLGRGISTKSIWRPYFQNAFENISFTKFFLKRNPYQTNFNRTCTKKILNKTCPPQTFWREVCTKQFRKKPPQKKEQIGQKYVMWHLYPKIVEGKILPKYIWSKVLHRTMCEGKLSTKQTLNKSFSKQFQKKPLPKNIWGNMPTKHR